MESTSEVSILLTPLDDSLPRTFTLNPSKSFIEIGRASKTASKGLAAAKGNAWFDSPIMSRSHAELVLVTNPVRALYLKDLRSTHGTFVGSKRISPDLEYAVQSGDVITFGTKVTSGQSTYPPKEFRIDFQWQQWSNPTLVASPESKNQISKSGFHFPYGGEDEDEDSSDDNVSRELSVEVIKPSLHQVVEPISQKTPASIKELAPISNEIEIVASHEVCSDLGNNAVRCGPQSGNLPFSNLANMTACAGATAQTGSKALEVLDLTRTASKEPQASEEIINFVGSSKANPIDLEIANPDAQPEIVSDSDDEPPEILPTSQASLNALPTTSSKDPFRYYAAMVMPPKTTLVDVSTVQKETTEATKPEATVPDSEADVSDEESDYSELGALCEPGSEVYSMGSSERDWSDDMSELEEDLERSHGSPALGSMLNEKPAVVNTNPPSNLRHGPEIIVDRHQLQVATWPPRMVISSPILACGDKDIPSTQWMPVARAPSPSDAALVRPPLARPSRASETQYRQHLHTRDSTAYPWFQSRLQEFRNNEDTELANTVPPWTENISSNPSLNYHSFPTEQYIDPMDRFLPRYDDGPFTGWPYSPPMQQDLVGNFTEASKPYNADIPRNQMISNPCIYNQAGHSVNVDWRRGNQKLEPADVIMTGRAAEQIMAPGAKEKLNQNDTLDNKSSKLPISDIVNDATKQEDGHARNLKRKADDMTASGFEESMVPEMTGVEDVLPSSQDSVLPDAQPRDDFGISASDLNETILRIQASVEELATTVEPPRKKVKIARTNSKPIKAFLSGMLVGCVGLVGACAAFIATIPEAVRDEALREM